MSLSGYFEVSSAGEYYTNANDTKIDTPIFNENGTVNAAAVTQLQNILTAVKSKGGNKTNYSAEDFGKYANGVMGDTDQFGIILVRLFPQNTDFTDLTTLTSLNTAKELQKAANEYWQLVYTTNSNGEIILTLYMANPYAIYKYQNTTSTNYAANYSDSMVRNKVNDLYTQLSNKFTALNGATVGAQSWQTADYQTGTTGKYSNAPTGSSFWSYDNKSYYAVANGMSGKPSALTASLWNGLNNNVPTDISSDKMWLPSNFEIYEGKGNDEYALSYTDGSADSMLFGSTDRSGLWRMNGYDRGVNEILSYSWLRSGFSGGGTDVCLVYNNGVKFSYVDSNFDVRPAMHLDLSSLPVEITTDAKGGTFSAADGWTLGEGNFSASKEITVGAAYGTLPAASRTGYTFDGWYSKDGTNGGDWARK